MKIGIINAGNLGMSLAVPWVKQDHDVMLSKDTHPDQLQERMRAFGLERGLSETEIEKFKYGSLADAANFGDIIIFSVYFPRLGHVLNEFRSAGVTFAGKIVIETMNALNVDANFNHYHDFEYMKRTSITEEIQKAFPEATLFQAFNQIPATLLDFQKWTSGRIPPVIYLGGNSSVVGTVRELIGDAGFRPQFAGYDLKNAGVLERLGVLLHLLVENEYEGDSGVIFDVVRHSG